MPQSQFSYGGEQYIVVSDTNPPTLWKLGDQGPQLISQPDSPGLQQQAAAALQSLGPRTASQAAGGSSQPTAFPTLTNPVAGTATPVQTQVANPNAANTGGAQTAAQVAGQGGGPTAFPSMPTITNPIAGTATQPVFQSNAPATPNVPRSASQVAGGNMSPTGWPSLSWPNLQVPGLSNPLAGTATQPVFQTANPNAANNTNQPRTATQVAGGGGGAGGSQPAAPAPATTTQPAQGGTRWVPDPNLMTGGYFVGPDGTPLPAAPGQQVLDKSGQPMKIEGGGFVPDPDAPRNSNQGGVYKPTPAAPAAPAKPDETAIQARILAANGRSGWTVTGVTDEPPKTVTENGIAQTTPTGRKVWAINGPNGKNDTMTVAPDPANSGDWVTAVPPKNIANDDRIAGDSKTGYYIKNAQGGWELAVPAATPNADEEVLKAVQRQVGEGDRNARQRNESQYGIYADDATTQKLLNDWANTGLRGQELQQKIAEYNKDFGEKQRQFDITQQAADRRDAANIAKTGAETTKIGADTTATQQTTQQSAARFPGILAQDAATLQGTIESNLTAAQARQIAAAPQLKGTPGGANALTTINPVTGQVDQSQMDLAYQPKTQAEIAARVGQIHTQMQQKSQQVQAKVGTMIAGKQFTPDDALKEFNSWYDTQVAPQTDALKAAQDDAAFARGKEQATMRASAMTAANSASTNAINAFNAIKAAHPVENTAAFNEAAEALSKGKMPANLAAATTWHAPNPIVLSQAATANALKYIDPTAAQAAGAPPPNYQNMDIGAMTRNPYMAPGVQQAPAFAGAAGGAPAQAAPAQASPIAPGPGAQPAPAPPGGTGSPDWWNGVMNRQAADVQLQRRQASAMPNQVPPGMFNPQYQAMYGSAVGQPATGPIAGDPTSLMPDWLKGGTPPPPGQSPLTSDGTPNGRPIVGFAPEDWWQRAGNYSPFQ